jgi:hypothetical protein
MGIMELLIDLFLQTINASGVALAFNRNKYQWYLLGGLQAAGT